MYFTFSLYFQDLFSCWFSGAPEIRNHHPGDSTLAASNLGDFCIDSTSSQSGGREPPIPNQICWGFFKGGLSIKGVLIYIYISIIYIYNISAKLLKVFGNKITQMFVELFGPDGCNGSLMRKVQNSRITR